MDEFGPIIFYTVIALMVVALFFVCFAFSRKESAPAGAAGSGAADVSSASEEGGMPAGTTADPTGASGDLPGNSGGESQTDASGGEGQSGGAGGAPGEGGSAEGSGENSQPEGSGEGETGADPAGGDPGAENGDSPPTVTAPDGTVFAAVNETVYALENVNMRTAPSTDGAVLAILNRGQSATRTGVSEFGWSQIVYEGNTVYVSSDYIGTAAP